MSLPQNLAEPNLQTGSGQTATKRSTASVVLRFIGVTLAVIVGSALAVALTIIAFMILQVWG